MNEFAFRGRRYAILADAPYARQVEVPVMWPIVVDAYSRGLRMLEVGNVLSNYRSIEHDVLDKYERGTGIINADAATYRPPSMYDLVVCISTIEHIGEGIQDPGPYKYKPYAACLNLLLYALKPGGSLYLTYPWRRRPASDKLLQWLPWAWVGFIKRINKQKWAEVDRSGLKTIQYNRPFKKANAVVVGEVKRP